ncbi:hypothetical protein OE749_10940 [Aestuariibacter sp. AA17]|uniref:Uncharacterized protein n=1 Tax=Fluctibacter corallii TaxID=2984329 RepID=A0ABT3A950_9ALTE|nr:hypothetical protein [Aestuariibacter sp. AA17]MCV2885207.1 hypothetical protein [Aestuariibacter sp. AA17]
MSDSADKAGLLGAVGLGDIKAKCVIYIANQPIGSGFESPDGVMALSSGDIADIGTACGNGWRKVFNVMAKLLFAARFNGCDTRYGSWQKYRDNEMLHSESGIALVFSPPQKNEAKLQIVMGKHYAISLAFPQNWRWLDAYFAESEGYQMIACPYFDYRQLTNQKIIALVSILQTYHRALLQSPSKD